MGLAGQLPEPSRVKAREPDLAAEAAGTVAQAALLGAFGCAHAWSHRLARPPPSVGSDGLQHAAGA